MLPLKLIRSLTSDKRAQIIGSAISVTNEVAAFSYLEATPLRLNIEKQTLHKNNEVLMPRDSDRWIISTWSTYYRAKNKRTKNPN